MKATKEYIERKFGEFNQMCFGGSLPAIPIKLSNARTFVGMCTYKRRRRLFGTTQRYDFCLRISQVFDLPEHELEDTVLHEMIHYYIGVNGIADSSAHGPVFRKMMNEINETYGRHITVSHKSTKEQREQLVDTRRRKRVVAVVKFQDGRMGIKVLPVIEAKVKYYKKHVGSSPEVSSIELYLTDNLYFNRYPCSSALRVIYLDESAIRENLYEASLLSAKVYD